jgi:hypothetical protein
MEHAWKNEIQFRKENQSRNLKVNEEIYFKIVFYNV